MTISMFSSGALYAFAHASGMSIAHDWTTGAPSPEYVERRVHEFLNGSRLTLAGTAAHEPMLAGMEEALYSADYIHAAALAASWRDANRRQPAACLDRYATMAKAVGARDEAAKIRAAIQELQRYRR